MNREKAALVAFYINMAAWYDGLTADGRAAIDQWIDTGNITVILPYVPRAVAEYFERRVKPQEHAS